MMPHQTRLSKPGVLKRFHAKDPQNDTYQPADPHFKTYATGTPIREDFLALAAILNHFNFYGRKFDMH